MFVIYKRKSKISKNVKINKIRMQLESRVDRSKFNSYETDLDGNLGTKYYHRNLSKVHFRVIDVFPFSNERYTVAC